MFQAPAHARCRYFSAPLSPELKKKHGTNAVPVRRGDTVRIMRGDRKGFEGKITQVDRQGYRIYVDGVTRTKVDGTSTQIPIHPSKTMITNLDMDDKWRRKTLERKGVRVEKEVPPPEEVVVEERIEEVSEVKEKPKAEATAKKPRRRKRKDEPEPSVKEEAKKPKKTRKSEKTETKPRRKRTKKAEAEEKGAE
jgi:large subunit ribosomal protein L24